MNDVGLATISKCLCRGYKKIKTKYIKQLYFAVVFVLFQLQLRRCDVQRVELNASYCFCSQNYDS